MRDGIWDVQNKRERLSGSGEYAMNDYVAFNWKDPVDAINSTGRRETVISDEEYVHINAYVTQTVAETDSVHPISKAGLCISTAFRLWALQPHEITSKNDAEQAIGREKSCH